MESLPRLGAQAADPVQRAAPQASKVSLTSEIMLTIMLTVYVDYSSVCSPRKFAVLPKKAATMHKRKYERFSGNMQLALQDVAPPAGLSTNQIENVRRFVIEDWQAAKKLLDKEETLPNFAATIVSLFTNVDVDTLLRDWKPVLVFLVEQQNLHGLGDKYVKLYKGALFTREGKICRNIKVTGEGKNQLLQWGTGQHHIAFRDFLKQMLDKAGEIITHVQQYTKEHDGFSLMSREIFMDSVATLMEKTGCNEKSAMGQLRQADQKLYRALNPGFQNEGQVEILLPSVEFFRIT